MPVGRAHVQVVRLDHAHVDGQQRVGLIQLAVVLQHFNDVGQGRVQVVQGDAVLRRLNAVNKRV